MLREEPFTTETQRHRERQKLEPQKARRSVKGLRDSLVDSVVAFGYRTGGAEMTKFNGEAPLTVVLMCSVGLPASANVKVAVSV